MSSRNLSDRLKRLQGHYGLAEDGILGPVTLTALERAAGLDPPWSLRVSRKSIEMIAQFEIISAANYRRNLMHPIWPGGTSGVTIGLGYDLGYRTRNQIEHDWIHDWKCCAPILYLDELMDCAGKKGDIAEDWLAATGLLRGIEIPLEVAREVFYVTSLPEYAKKTRRAFPGVELLPADAQGALLSLVYNRGASMSGARRHEMKEIRRIFEVSDPALWHVEGWTTETPYYLKMIADKIRAMKRLWIGKNLDGLLKRRDREARLVERSDREYETSELVSL